MFHACFDVGDVVAVGTTCYPCYRNILQAMEVSTVSVPLNAEYKVTVKELEAEVERRKAAGLPPLKGFIQSSPSNPTGAMVSPEEVRDLCAFCARAGIWFISDEIYQGISFGSPEASALRYAGPADTTIVVNSFSKYYSMTGWRLGWVVLPEALVPAVNRLQQNMFINAPTVSQVAARACFSPSTDAVLKGHVTKYRANRDIVLAALKACGIADLAPAEGAIYAYADLGDDSGAGLPGGGSEALCAALLEEEGVALTPGTDFECPLAGRGPYRVRVSFPGATADVAEAMALFSAWWPKWCDRVRRARRSGTPVPANA